MFGIPRKWASAIFVKGKLTSAKYLQNSGRFGVDIFKFCEKRNISLTGDLLSDIFISSTAGVKIGNREFVLVDLKSEGDLRDSVVELIKNKK